LSYDFSAVMESAIAGSEWPSGDRQTGRMLVLGVGNVLLEDEGLGVRALEILQQRYQTPEGLEWLDGGTTGMGLLEMISDCDHLLVLDAVQTGAPPGTLVRMTNEEVPVYFGLRITPHQLGLSDVLATLELGLVPESMELSLELSGHIRSRLETLVAAAVDELANLGYRLVPV
jgi:hydrogenase maturation protease